MNKKSFGFRLCEFFLRVTLSGLIPISCILFIRSLCFATIDPQTVQVLNASAWQRPTIQPTTPGTGDSPIGGGQSGNLTVYGGIMGPTCTGSTTCNNCTTNNTTCNENRISPESYLTFKFRTDNASVITPSSKILIVYGATTVIPGATGTSAPMLNAEMTLTVKWRDLCNALEASTSPSSTSSAGVCDISVGKKSIQIGISSDSNNTLEESLNIDVVIAGDASSSADYRYVTSCEPDTSNVVRTDTGFCWVEILKGDEKVYIDQGMLYYSNTDNFIVTPFSGSNYKALRVYYESGNNPGSDDNFSTTVNSLSTYKDFTFTIGEGNKPTLNDFKITGLENNKRYYFMFANVDEAGNIFFFSSNKAEAPTNYYLRHNLHSQMPAEVSGALEGKECFIATAAYGSPLVPQLEILRTFRDRYLIPNSIGRWLVKKYYLYGPGWAQKIKNREMVKAGVRTALNPIVSVAQWVILYGLKSFILISLVGFILGFLILRRVIRDYE